MKKQTLAEKYRPETWEDFKGSEFPVGLIRGMIAQGELPSCIILSGPRGTGKTTIARLINAEVNAGTFDPLSYVEIDAASHNGIGDIRNLQELIQYHHEGNYRVIALDEAHMLTTAAFNGFLKALEDPPEKTVFILITTKPEAILDTVRSRAMKFRLSSLSIPDIARRLMFVIQKEKINIKDPKLVVRIAEVSDGSLRDGLVLLQQLTYLEQPTLVDINELSGHNVSTKDLLYAMVGGSIEEVEVELMALFSKTINVENLLSGIISTLKQFHETRIVSNKSFLSCMEVLWNMRKIQTGSTVSARIQLEAGLYFMFSQNFWNGAEPTELGDVQALTTADLQAVSE